MSECVCGHPSVMHDYDTEGKLAACSECEDCDTYRSLDDASETAWMEGRATL